MDLLNVNSTYANEKLIQIKKKLVKVLGVHEKEYWNNIKAWLMHKMTKEEFDIVAQRLLKPADIQLHNQFFLALLEKCHLSLSSFIPNPSLLAYKGRTQSRFDSLMHKYDHRYLSKPPPQQEIFIKPCSRTPNPSNLPPVITNPRASPFLLNANEIYSYSFLVTWEMGLEDAESGVGKVLEISSRMFLKHLLTLIISRHSAHKLIGCFQVAHGLEAENPYLLRKRRRYENPLKLDASEKLQNFGRSSQICKKKITKLTLEDFLNSLQFYRRQMIPPSNFYSYIHELVMNSVCSQDHDSPTSKELKLVACQSVSNNTNKSSSRRT